MAIFDCLKWPEMRAAALELIARMHEGHAGGGPFAIPAVEFVRIFSPGADAGELEKIAARGDIQFRPDSPDGGTFQLAPGERALFDLHRDALVLRIPVRMSGRYELRPGAFRIDFNPGEELEGCKRLLLLICNRVVSVEVSPERVDVRAPQRIFDLCVEFG